MPFSLNEPLICNSGNRFYAILVSFFLLHVSVSEGAEKGKKVEEFRDPVGQSFRLAPMAVAPRTVAVPLAEDVHLAFDTELLRTFKVWKGPGLNLYGTPYRNAKTPFYCSHSGEEIINELADFPWRREGDSTEVLNQMPDWVRYRGLSDKSGRVTFLYEFQVGGKKVPVQETARVEKGKDGLAVVRRFEMGACPKAMSFFAHSWLGKGIGGSVSVSGGKTSIAKDSRKGVSFTSWLWKPKKNDCERTTVRHEGDLTRQVVKIPAHTGGIAFEVVTSFGSVRETTLEATPDLDWEYSKAKGKAKEGFVTSFESEKPTRIVGNEFFQVEHLPIPKDILLQATGLDFFKNGDMAICTWSGDVYILKGADGPLKEARIERFARGLCEPGGLTIVDGIIHVVQKVELTRLVDTDGDGQADWFDCLNQGWGSTGNYHDFSFGPVVADNGDLYVYRTGNRGVWELPYMGWAIRVSKDGSRITPVSSGLRSPNGYGTYKGSVFMADNQGNWMGTCTLNHIKEGKFYGYPSSWPAPKEDYAGREHRDAPAIWFPYKLSASTSDMKVAEDDRFGPFKGQLIVGDWKNANLMRVTMEQVNGEWQGTVWPLVTGFGSGVNRFAFGPDGKLYVGGCKNGAWAALGPYEASLDRVSWTGKKPFEVLDVNALPDGFKLTFTQRVDLETAADAQSYDVLQYRYDYHQKYGSPEIGHDGKPNSHTTLEVVKAEVAKDRMSVKIRVKGLREGFVTVIRPLDVENEKGDYLWHDEFYYTLNALPKR